MQLDVIVLVFLFLFDFIALFDSQKKISKSKIRFRKRDGALNPLLLVRPPSPCFFLHFFSKFLDIRK